MIVFESTQLLRALDVAAIPARLVDPTLPVLCTVVLESTDQGLLAYSTDRYQLARTLTEYADPAPGHGEGLPPVTLHRDSIKLLLPALKSQPKSLVAIAADAQTVTFTIGAQTISLDNHASDRDFPKVASLFRLHTTGAEGIPSEGAFTLNPKFLKGLVSTLARYTRGGEALTFSPDPQSTVKPVAWMYGDWAHGLMMPIRLDAFRTMKNEGDKLARLFRAQPLMESPESASVQEESAAVRTGTREVPSTA